MGKTTKTTSTQQLLAPLSEQEKYLQGLLPDQIKGLEVLSGGVGEFVSRLQGIAGQVGRDFAGLPSPVTIADMLMGGTTPSTAALLDRLTSRSMVGARENFNQSFRDIMDSAAGASSMGAAASGLSGWQGPMLDARRLLSKGASDLAVREAETRANIGTSVGGGLLTLNQQAMGNLLGIGQQILAGRGQQANILGAAADIGLRGSGLATQRSLATGKQVGTQTTTESDPLGTISQIAGLGMTALGGMGMMGRGPMASFMGQGKASQPGQVSTPSMAAFLGMPEPQNYSGDLARRWGINMTLPAYGPIARGSIPMGLSPMSYY